MQIKLLIDNLVEQLLKWDYAYYVRSEPIVTDAVYDSVFRRLQDLEKQNPEFIRPDSPTQKVSGTVDAQFKITKHSYPMLSIKTETNPSLESLTNWMRSHVDKIRGLDPKISLVCEYKYDGLGLSLKYSKGKLVRALTRGDCILGEDVLANAIHIHGIPVSIDKNGSDQELVNFIISNDFEIRGEVLFYKEDYEKVNAYQRANGLKEYVNARNAASGTLRTLDSTVVAKRHLRFMPYSIKMLPDDAEKTPGNEDYFSSQSDVLHAFEKLGFIKPGLISTIGYDADISEYFKMFLDVKAKRQDLPYEIDGVVFKVNELCFQEQLGYRHREPVWAVAYKFPPEEAITYLAGIDTQVGRTGKLTPVARLKPVYVGGATISNVTLHNLFDLRARDVRPGDMVIVRRAGDVIPEIVRPLKDQRNWYYNNFKFIACPCCGSKPVRLKGEREYRCMNTLGCSAQVKRAIEHFASRAAMRIDGLGEALIDKLYDENVVTKLTDIYELTVDKLTDIGIGKKVAQNLIESIEKSKTTTFAKFIYALGIPNVGEGTSVRLSEYYHHVYQFMEDQTSRLITIPDIGPVTAESIVRFFKDLANMDQASNLFIRFLNIQQEQITSDKLSGLTFVVTGSFDGFDRDGIKNWIKTNGGNVVSSVSKNVDYLVAGDNPGDSKVSKAGILKIPVIDFQQLSSLRKES